MCKIYIIGIISILVVLSLLISLYLQKPVSKQANVKIIPDPILKIFCKKFPTILGKEKCPEYYFKKPLKIKYSNVPKGTTIVPPIYINNGATWESIRI